MDIATLAVTVYGLARPFLEKTGEGVARKIGEDIWNLIKSPFLRKKGDDVKSENITELEFTEILSEELQSHPELIPQLNHLISEAQITIQNSGSQNITNNAEIQKQLNIKTNTGPINF